MLNYPDINPVALQIGPVKIFWYGITYLVGFTVAWLLGRYRAYQRGDWTAEQVTDMMFYMVLAFLPLVLLIQPVKPEVGPPQHLPD